MSSYTMNDFKEGDRVRYIGELGVKGRVGTVKGVRAGEYVRVRWDDQEYNGFRQDSSAYPYNIEPIDAPPDSPEKVFAASLRKMAADARDRAKTQNRIADKAEALAREMDGTNV